MSELPRYIKVTPSKSGNGFYAGQQYAFKWYQNTMYQCTLKTETGELWYRYASYDQLTSATPSPHLWDGTGVFEAVAGHWEVVG